MTTTPTMPADPPGVDDKTASEEAAPVAPDEAVRRLEERAEAIRENLGGLVDELDERAHRVIKPAMIVAAVLLGAAVVGGVVVWRRRRRSPPTWAARIRQALRRAVDHPERVAEVQPAVGKKIAAAAGAALASLLVRRLADRWLPPPSRS